MTASIRSFPDFRERMLRRAQKAGHYTTSWSAEEIDVLERMARRHEDSQRRITIVAGAIGAALDADPDLARRWSMQPI